MTAPEVCPSCNTTLRTYLDNGSVLVFTGHTPEYCALATRSHVKMLQNIIERNAIDLAFAERGRTGALRMLDELDDPCVLEGVRGRMINEGERLHEALWRVKHGDKTQEQVEAEEKDAEAKLRWFAQEIPELSAGLADL